MRNDIAPKNSELLIELSEQEQEVVSGGRSRSSFELRDLFFQKTNIRSSANSGFSTSLNGTSFSDQSGYTYSQTTLSIGSFLLGNRRGGRKSRGSSGIDLLSCLIFTLLYS